MQINFNATHIDILPTDESYCYRSIMGEHTLTLYFSLSTYTEIPTGAWCEFANERYTLNQPAKIVKHNTRNFEYTLTMDSEGANLKNYKFRNPNDKTLKFPFTASPRYHVQILVDCLNMIDSGWQVGNCIEASEKLVSYSHNNCLEALEMIAKAFETEYEIIGKTIHLHKVEYFKDNPLPLQYGKGKGFKTGVSRNTEQGRITRLYVQGGERNIDRSKYGNKELLLPKSQEYVYEGVTFVSDDKGLSIAIKNAQNNGFVNEQSLDLSHIYPKRKGTISAVFEVDKAKHFYDFTDTSIPQALDFNAMQIKGEKMLIYFESGMLSGREFEVNHYDHAQKRFQLQPKEEDGVTMPNDIFKPAIGDQYSVYNMQMPNAYISDNTTKSGASWEMMKEACKYLYENRADHFTFTGDLDGIWAKKHWVNVGGRLKMGAYIHFSDTEFQRTPVAIRIVGLKEYVNNPYSPQIELSNKVQGQSFATEMRKLQNQEVYFGELNKRTQSLTKRSWRDAQETIKQIEAAFPEYTKSIVPATVQTMMALIGNKSTQFDFVVSKTNPIKTPHTLYFDKNSKQINAGSGWLKHFTLGTTDINPNRDANSYKYWNIPAFVSGRLDDKAKTYYLYIKASKTDETAEFILSENKIDLEQEAGFYHFLYATVNSEYEGERGIAKLNGFTEITGGQIKTDKITSGNGQQYIQLFDDRIEIKANLKITDGNKTEIKQLVSPDLLSLKNRLKSSINNIHIGGRNLLKNSGIKITNNSYLIAAYDITTELKEGETVTATIKGKLGTGKVAFALYNSGNSVEISTLKDVGNGIYQNTFSWRIGVTKNKSLWIWTYQSNIVVDSTIEWIKLERGNKPTDWSPAPEDVWYTMVDLGIIDKNAMNLTEAEKANVKFINGMFSKGTDYINGTEVVKNTITTGALTVGNTLGGNAGINGAGLSGESIRFFAGSGYDKKEEAPFRVQDDGVLFTSKIKAKGGEISGDLVFTGGLYSKEWDKEKNHVKGGTKFGGTGLIYRDDPNGLMARFGSISGSVFGANGALMRIDRDAKYPKSSSDLNNFTGQIISVPPHPNDETDTLFGYRNNRAQTLYGDTLSFGANAHFEYSYYGVAGRDTIMDWIGVTHKFVFTDVLSNFNEVWLPNYNTIANKLNKMGIPVVSRNRLYPYYELTIIMAYKDQVGNKRIRVQIESAGGGGLITNDGDILSYIDMGSGDVLTLACSPAAYYIKSHRS
nr:MAG TPA: tail protein [Caudoviricetes sp.]